MYPRHGGIPGAPQENFLILNGRNPVLGPAMYKNKRDKPWGFGSKERTQFILTFVLETLTFSSVSPEYFPRPPSLLDTVCLSLYPGRCVFPGSKDDLEARMVQKQEDLVISTLDYLFTPFYEFSIYILNISSVLGSVLSTEALV